jgi:hypothetical protein
MPAEMIKPYVPVSGPALGDALGVLDAVAVGWAEGEANGLGDPDALDPPPHESTSRTIDTPTAPRRMKPNSKAGRLTRLLS